jgi:GTPase Era involved in 16S rRNA processing
MTFSKNPYFDGSNPYEAEYEVEEEIENEVFEIVKEAIENGADEIPESIRIKIDDFDGTKIFSIDPIDYLTCEQITELENLIEKGEE